MVTGGGSSSATVREQMMIAFQVLFQLCVCVYLHLLTKDEERAAAAAVVDWH